MGDNRPCNCDQALELTKALYEMATYVENHVAEVHHFELRDKARAAQELMDKHQQAIFEANRCQHCGKPGGH